VIPKTSLRDVRDVEAFVAKHLVKSGVRFSPDEHDEMLAEGIALLYELEAGFEEHRDGYEQAGSFAGYAASLLPRRMRDVYRRLHPEHLERRNPDGSREIEYAPPAVSLHHEDLPQFGATMIVGPVPEDTYQPNGYEPPPMVASAMCWVPFEHRAHGRALRVVELMEDGHGTDEIARLTVVNRREVGQIQGAIASAVFYQQSLEAA
jgi:hypothetical protein